MTEIFAIFCGLLLAYANGANDNFKGVSTLFGSGTTDYKRALIWATATTFLGSVTALLTAQGLLATFSGKGLVPNDVLALKSFPISVVLASGLTVMLATFPQGTSSGQALALYQEQFTPQTLPTVRFGTTATCQERYSGTLYGIEAQTVLDFFHFLSAGIVSFARGLNDTPKIAALLLVGGMFSPAFTIISVAVAIAMGGLLNGKKVAETLSHKVTAMNAGQGFTANLVTSVIVIFASNSGLPVSTTHVSCGALFGIGAVIKQARWTTIAGILAAWVTTLPIAALFGALFFLVMKGFI